MQFLSRLKITTRLALAFGLIVIGFGIAVAIALAGLHRNSQMVGEYFHGNQTRLTAYQNMYADGLLSGVALRNLVLKPKLQKPYKVVPAAIRRFEDYRRQALEASQDRPALLDELAAIYGFWEKSRDAKQQVLELMRQGKVAEATELLRKVEHPNWQQVRIRLQKLIDRELESARGLQQAILAQEDRTEEITLLVSVGILVLGGLVAAYFLRNTRRAFTQVTASLEEIASGDGDLTRRMPDQGNDELAEMGRVFNRFMEKLQLMVDEVRQGSERLREAAGRLTELSVRTKSSSSQQQHKIQQVAEAMQGMTATVQSVAHNATAASTSAQAADQEASRGRGIVGEVVQAINELASEVEHTATTISRLEEDTVQIGGGLDVIRGIAEQTNLLALNAAIEAARAGEQGRGFAVVADEVRTLASRTQDSTEEIQNMIERLQAGAREAVSAMEQGRQRTSHAVETARSADEALQGITGAVSTIAQMNSRIATAADEQSGVAEAINRNVADITGLAGEAARSAEDTARSSEEMAAVSAELTRSISAFRT
ncbi:MAG TPA: methyl-accepting chemotaxis protein [Gammaproteobacteria bacterium]|nr:methyl-accepting chemotaxis protein [Gammaproteobacteria bacterium]